MTDMKDISMKEFARLCKSDPALFKQVIAMPGTVSLDRLMELAGQNGYNIVPDQCCPEKAGMEALADEQLDRVTGGLSLSERQAAWKDWFVTWTGAENA